MEYGLKFGDECFDYKRNEHATITTFIGVFLARPSKWLSQKELVEIVERTGRDEEQSLSWIRNTKHQAGVKFGQYIPTSCNDKDCVCSKKKHLFCEKKTGKKQRSCRLRQSLVFPIHELEHFPNLDI